MGPIAIAYGIAAAAVLALSAYASWRDHAIRSVGLAVMLFVLWCVSNALVVLGGFQAAFHVYPALDAIGGLLTLWAWVRRKAEWRKYLLLTFLAMLSLHVWYDDNRREVYAQTLSYWYALNALTALQLAIVAFPGGRYVAMVDIRRFLSSGRRRVGGISLPPR